MRKWFFGLRRKFVFPLLIVALVIFLVRLAVLIQTEKTAEKKAEGRLLFRTKVYAQAVAMGLADEQSTLVSLAKKNIWDEKKDCDSFVKAYLLALADKEGLEIWSEEGKPFCHAPGQPQAIHIKRHPYLLEALEKGTLVISPLILDHSQNEPFVALAMPLGGKGKRLVATIKFPASRLQKIVDDFSLSFPIPPDLEAHPMLFDKEGKAIAWSGVSFVFKAGASFKNELGHWLSGEDQVGRALLIEGVPGIRTSSAVPIVGAEPSLHLMLAVKEKELFGPLRQRFYLDAAMVFLVTGLAVIFVLWMGENKIAKPLEILKAAAKRIQEGDLTVPVPSLPGKDEICELAMALESMRITLKEAMTEREDALHRIWVANQSLEREVAWRTHELLEETARLAESEACFAAAFNGVKEGIVLTESDGRCLLVNSSFCNMVGSEKDKILDSRIQDWHPVSFHSELQQKLQALAEESMAFAFSATPALRQEGSLFPADISAQPISWKGKPCAVIVYRDATERLLLENLRTRNAREAAMQRDALVLFNAALNEKGLLKGLFTLLSQHKDLLSLAYFFPDPWSGDLTHPSFWGEPLDQDKASALARESVSSPGLVLRNGESPWLGAFALRHHGAVQGVLVWAREAPLDAAERVFFEQMLSHLAVAMANLARLEDLKLMASQLKARQEIIEEKNRELEAASRAKSDFLATMSHELRTPLNAIMGFSELLKEGLAGDLTEEQLEYAREIFTAAEHLLSLINDILDLSKVEAGKMSLDLQPVDISSLVDASLLFVRERAQKRGVKLESHANIDACIADERKLKQIVINLLSNAVKFTEKGKVWVTARKVRGEEIYLSAWSGDFHLLEANASYLEILVWDTGTGIAKEHLKKLFHPFTQLDSSLSRRHQGTGLGLALVRQLALLHEGMIGVQSSLGAGSVFGVWILWREGTEAKEASLAQGIPVVMVSSDEAVVRTLSMILQENGFSGRRAKSIEEAMAWVEHGAQAILWDAASITQEENSLKEKMLQVPLLTVVPHEESHDQVDQVDLHHPARLVQSLFKALDYQKMLSQVRVLVIDEDPHAIRFIEKALLGAKEVIAAYSGPEGLEMAREKKPDVIITDLMMPGMDGFEVSQHLKSDPALAATPIIILTAKSIEEEDIIRLSPFVKRIAEKALISQGRLAHLVVEAMQ